MDIVRAFTYITDDEEWQSKVPITLILGIIPIINLVVIGWMLDLIRNMIDGAEKPMPDWQNLGENFVERWTAGLMTGIAALIYMIPSIVILMVLGALLAALRLGFLSILITGVFMGVYAAVIWMPLSIGMMRYARTRDFNHYLQIGRNIALARENLATLITLAAFILVVSILFSLVSYIPCIGWLLSLVMVGVTAIVAGHLTGQAALEIARNRQGQA